MRREPDRPLSVSNAATLWYPFVAGWRIAHRGPKLVAELIVRPQPMKNKDTIRWRISAVLLGIVLISPLVVKSAETNFSGIVEYVFEPNPQKIKPKMHNWVITLNAADSTNGTYEIVQITRSLDVNGGDRGTTNILIGVALISHMEMIIPNEHGMIEFNLHVGAKEPKRNMNAPGNIGQPVTFSGIGTGRGGSSWIVLPGSKVDKVAPSAKGTQLSDGRLSIIQYIVTNDAGKKFQADVMLHRK